MQEDEDVGELWEGLLVKKLPWHGADVLTVVRGYVATSPLPALQFSMRIGQGV